MDDTLERAIGADDFERTEEVLALSRKSYIVDEIVEAIPAPRRDVVEAVSRQKVHMLSNPGAGRAHRRFHVLDIYSIAIFIGLNRAVSANTDYVAESRKKLIIEIDHLLWGDLVTPAEKRARQPEFAAKRAKAYRGTEAQKRKNDKFILRLHEQRRQDLLADIFSAPPHVWVRDPDRNFVLFLRKDVSLSVGLIDRNGPTGGRIDTEPFFEQGFMGCMNLTKSLTGLDERLRKIIDERGGPELVEAD
jgi:hypothetical protein